MGIRINDLTGKVFGRLTVTSLVWPKRKAYVQWNCKCTCGNEKVVASKHLVTGSVKSCGCITNQEDLVGKRFSRVEVLSFHSKTPKGNHVRWNCICDCGKVMVVLGGNLKNGHTNSCGCYRDERRSESHTKHGLSGTAEFVIWAGMRQRCNNPENTAYKRYGGRGIKVCRRWDKFENFLSDMGKRPSPELSIDRINNNKGYSKSNCRWGTDEEQRRNKSNNRWIEADGKKMILADWAKYFGMYTQNLYRDLKKWSIEEIILRRQKL